MIYFISDLHFGHRNLLKYERTEFADVNEHDDHIVHSINTVVSDADTLYILGDVFNLDKIHLIRGRKILMLGNHDHKKLDEYYNYFSCVFEYPIYYNKKILLSHHPHPVSGGVLNVHGHLHSKKLDSPNHFCVSAKNIDYKPVSIDELNNMAEGLFEGTKYGTEWYSSLVADQ